VWICDIYIIISQACIQAAQEECLGITQHRKINATGAATRKSQEMLLEAPIIGKAKGNSKSSKQLQGTLDDHYDFVKPSLDYSSDHPRRKRMAWSGNPLITVVNVTGICNVEILPCICDN